jgi:hypothetical protein
LFHHLPKKTGFGRARTRIDSGHASATTQSAAWSDRQLAITGWTIASAWQRRDAATLEIVRAVHRFTETATRSISLFSQFRTENRFTLFLKLL